MQRPCGHGPARAGDSASPGSGDAGWLRGGGDDLVVACSSCPRDGLAADQSSASTGSQVSSAQAARIAASRSCRITLATRMILPPPEPRCPVQLAPGTSRGMRGRVRGFAIDLIPELVRTGRAWGSGAQSPRDRRGVGSLTGGVPEGPGKKMREVVSDRGRGVRGRGSGCPRWAPRRARRQAEGGSDAVRRRPARASRRHRRRAAPADLHLLSPGARDPEPRGAALRMVGGRQETATG
jgi:hypothetical protein